jgi:isopentenyldiphosphate isomerase
MTYLLENKLKGTKMYRLIEMLRYKRPEGSVTQREFCKRFLEPVFGAPDPHGNYIMIIGDNPRVAFMSHHDTVHSQAGMQTPYICDDFVYIDQDCLGADCTTGIYIMLSMIELGIEGVYVVHAAEEVGCVGSSAIVADNPLWLSHIDIAISFDRFGTTSIITHQMGERTCSDAFARSFSNELGMWHVPDTKGSFTDSNEYRGVISECTNLSVGYYHQHSAKESQDLQYLDSLVEAMAQVDWSKLVVDREPRIEYDDSWFMRGHSSYSKGEESDEDDMYDFVYNNPQFVEDYLESFGISVDDMMEELYNQQYKFGVN